MTRLTYTPSVRHCSRCRTLYERDERFCPLDGAAVVEGEGRDREDARDRLIGQTLAGRYLLVREIGKGGMGVVYEAEHVGLGKRVAVKLLLDGFSDDREVLARFHMEARNASRIGHENIIDIVDIGEHVDGARGRSFIVMEFLEGTDLRRVCQGGALPLRRTLAILDQVCRALGAAHAKDIIHRDMKPENVFLTERLGRTDFVKLMDFGISKIKAAHDSQVRLTQTGAVVGTPLYMAPEQALGKTDIDHRVDVYSVGVMMYELCTGQPPFSATTYLGLMTQHVHEKPTNPRRVRPELPAAIERVILRALEKEPGKRFATMEEMRRALPPPREVPDVPGTIVAGSGSMSPVRGEVATSAPTVVGGRRQRFMWIAAAAAGVVGLGAVGVWVALGDGGRGTGSGTRAPGSGSGSGSGSESELAAGPSVEAIAPYGSLDLKSEPVGAQVFVDGKPLGVTPIKIERVTTGTHTVRLERDGFVAVEVQKLVRGDVSETFVLTAERRGKGGGTSRPPEVKTREVKPPEVKPEAKPEGKPPEKKPPRNEDDPPNPYLEDEKNPYLDD